MPLGLDEWYVVSAMFVTNANEDWFTLVGDEDICLFVDGDAIMSKNGNGAIITDLTDAHERLREVGKGIGGCSSGGQVFERKVTGVQGFAGATVCNSDTFCGGVETGEMHSYMVCLTEVVSIVAGVKGDHGVSRGCVIVAGL